MAAGVTDGPDYSRTILVMGVDARPGAPIDIAVRPDALMVLRLDQETQSCRLLAIPRDTRVRLPGYGQTKVNHALMVGGIPYQRLVVEQFLSIEIDSYVLIDFAGFEKLVDAAGGITVDVPEAIAKPGFVFAAGGQTFDGAQALSYVRYRADAQGDIGRIHRQWAVLQGLLTAGSGRDLAGDVNTILPALEDHLRTDLEAADFAAIAQTYGGRCTVETIGTTLLHGIRVRLDDPMLQQSVYYNDVTETQVREAVATLVAPEPDSAPAPDDPPAAGRVPVAVLDRTFSDKYALWQERDGKEDAQGTHATMNPYLGNEGECDTGDARPSRGAGRGLRR